MTVNTGGADQAMIAELGRKADTYQRRWIVAVSQLQELRDEVMRLNNELLEMRDKS